MIGFMFFSLLLIIIVLWLITPALLGKRAINTDDTDSQNTAIAKERLSELELRLEQGDISQQQFDQMEIEIEKSLLEDIHDGEDTPKISPKIEKNAYVIITAIPLMALALYWLWGSPDSINLSAQATPQTQSPTAVGNTKHTGSVEDMALLLEAKLKKDPKNPNGWFTLARTYMSLKKYDRAVGALKRLRKLVGDDVTVLITLADAMTMARAGRMEGEPFELIKKALEQKPNDPTVLWLAGLGYSEVGNTKIAVKLWKKLLPLITNEPRSVHQVQLLIVAAERKMGLEPTIEVGKFVEPAQTAVSNNKSKVAGGASIRVTVKLDDASKSKASPNDFVLVYARASKGSKMPLAIVRKQIKDLPMTFILDDSMAMQPAMKLSNFAEVDIVARISKSGQAMQQSGDLQGQLGPVKVKGTKSVSITINMGLKPTIDISQLVKPSQKTAASNNKPSAASRASIRVTVKLADSKKDKVSPNDFVLVYARAASGPRMPLAIVRKQVKDLPMTLVLDDSMAMRPTMKLSNFAKVDIVARISKLGQAMPQSGDLQGQFGPIKVKGAKPVTVIIDKVLP